MMRGLTAVPGITVGHHRLAGAPTGCTVVVAADGAVPGVEVRGGAPGTRETALLDPVNTVAVAHAVVLSGGSAFGLDTASGVVRYLAENDVGYATRAGKVPIVPAAILYDLGLGPPDLRPDAEAGYLAAAAAGSGPVAEGSAGAGAGATLGKLLGVERAMKGGLSTAAVRVGELVVAALVAVDSVGDVVDPATGEVIAGVRTEDGARLADARKLLRRATVPPRGTVLRPAPGENTTLGVIATNARLHKAEVTKVARVAHNGIARAVCPAHTPYDGDALFALATGHLETPVELLQVAELAADVVAEAIVRAARAATGLPGFPAARDL